MHAKKHRGSRTRCAAIFRADVIDRLERRVLLSGAPPVAVNQAFTAYEDQALNVPSVGSTALTFTGSSGNWIYPNTPHTWTPVDGTFNGGTSGQQTVDITFNGSGENWTLMFAAPAGGMLVTGATYTNVGRWGFQSAGQAGLDIFGDGRGANTVSGSFTIREIASTPGGALSSFAASFTDYPDGATPLTGTVEYKASLPGSYLGVLANNVDPENDLLTASLVSGPSHGTVTLNADGTFVYTPLANFNGTDSFAYQSFDGTSYSNVATATITVVPVNDPPTFTPGPNVSGAEDSGPQVVANWASNISAGPADEAGQSLSFAVTADSNTALFAVPPAVDPVTGTLTYTPAPGERGTADVSVVLKDNAGTANGGVDTSKAATFAITLTPVNHAPVAANDTYFVTPGQSLTIAPTPGATALTINSEPGDWVGQGMNATFTPATGTFTVSNVYNANTLYIGYQGSGPIATAQGWSLALAAPFNARITPGAYNNAARWPFQSALQPGLDLSGDGRGSNTLTGSFNVTQAQYSATGTLMRLDATFVQHSEGATAAATGRVQINAGPASGLLANDSDPDGDYLTASLVAGPAHGSLTLNADGTFTYVPAADFVGIDSFTYVASDGVATSNVATVTLNVIPPGPWATLSAAGPVPEGSGGAVSFSPPIDANPNAAPFTYSYDFDDDGTFEVTNSTSPTSVIPAAYLADGPATAVVHARIRDSAGVSNDFYVPIQVLNVPPTPAIFGWPASVSEGQPVSLTAFATDPSAADANAGFTFAWTVTKNGAPFASYTDPAGQSNFSFTPDDNGRYAVTLTATDKDGGAASTSPATIVATNWAPSPTIDGLPGNLLEGHAISLTAAAFDPSPIDMAAGFTYAWSVTKNGAPFVSYSDPAGQAGFTFTPDDNGTYAVTLSATDKDGGTGTITIPVVALDVGPSATFQGLPIMPREGSAMTLTATATDPSPVDTAAGFAYAWQVTKNGNPFAKGTGATFTFTPDDNGTYQVSLAATDKDGATGTGSSTFSVANVPPVALITGPSVGKKNKKLSFTFSANDPSPVDQSSPFTYLIDWNGDGIIDQTVTASSHLTLTHSFRSAGTYHVSLYVKDKDGGLSALTSLKVVIGSHTTG